MKKEDMLGSIMTKIVGLPIEFLGALYDLTEKFLGEDGKEWLEAFKKFLRKEKSWTVLKLARRIRIPATTEKLVVKNSRAFQYLSLKKRITKLITKDSGDLVMVLTPTFDDCFCDVIADPIVEQNINCYQVLHDLEYSDQAMFEEIERNGGYAPVTITEMLYLVEKQFNGEDGPLLMDGRDNIFFIPDSQNTIRRIFCRREKDGQWIGETYPNQFCSPEQAVKNDRLFTRSR